MSRKSSSYRADCLKVLRFLLGHPRSTRRQIAKCLERSETGATARFRQCRAAPYNAVMECDGDYLYSVIFIPKKTLEAMGLA